MGEKNLNKDFTNTRRGGSPFCESFSQNFFFLNDGFPKMPVFFLSGLNSTDDLHKFHVPHKQFWRHLTAARMLEPAGIITQTAKTGSTIGSDCTHSCLFKKRGEGK